MEPASELRIRHRVAFSETDMAGIAHFSNFFRYMEQAEAALFRHLDVPLIEDAGERLSGFPRVRASCDYAAPLRFNEVLETRLRITELTQGSVHFGFRFFRIGDGEEARVAKGLMVTAFAVMSRADGELAPCRIGDSAHAALDAWRKSGANIQAEPV